ncbi:MAG: NAD+ synthase, partial [Lysobacterales bacterium]
PGQGTCVFQAGEGGDAISIGLLICEDAWFEEPARLAKEAGAELLVVINASPFHVGKGGERELTMRSRALATGLPLVYAHLVGGQDEIVFEGRSFALQADGTLAGRAESFKENLFVAQVERAQSAIKLIANTAPERSSEADLWDALVLGVRDYLGKNGFPGALLGLSGGIDSALVLAIAVDALGADKVRTVMMPSPYTADISWIDAREMAQRMKVRYDEISIVPEFEAFKASLAGEFKGLKEDTTEENIQARIRGVLLMALSNKLGAIVLTTGNKSEMATGYCTLYGDMAGGLSVIADVPKTMVYDLARYVNRIGERIPRACLEKAPSAELRPNQTDQDTLPPYEILDVILKACIEEDLCASEIAKKHKLEIELVRETIRRVNSAEYKRQQAAPALKVTAKAFGMGRRYPIAQKFKE